MWQDCIRKSPNKARPHYNLGDALARQGKTEQAIHHLYKAVQIKPDFTAAQNNLGGQLLKQGSFDEALDHFTAALEVDPNLAEAHNNVPDSIAWLKQAIDKGYRNWKLIKTDKDLANIRHSRDYRQLVEGH